MYNRGFSHQYNQTLTKELLINMLIFQSGNLLMYELSICIK